MFTERKVMPEGTVTLSPEEQDRLAKEQMAKFWKPVLELEAIQLAARAEQERQE